MSANEIVGALQGSFTDGIAPDDARALLEENGFECKRISNGTFVHRTVHDDGTATNQIVEDINFIRCVRTTRDGILVTYTDSIALVVENELVVDALSHWDAVGP